MDKALASFVPYAYAILRLIAGLLFISHSGQKLFGWFGGDPVPVASLFGVAALMEMLLGLLITLFHFLVYGDSGLWNLEYRCSTRERAIEIPVRRPS